MIELKRLTAGILAHVDAGKTTLTEALLYHSGDIRTLGRVDRKDAFLDTFALEKSRGITIYSKQAVLHADGCEITLLDTPGHVDFSAETERVLQVLDYAILLISATDGVQSHTETLWHLLKSYRVPVFIFVNKTDLAGKGREELLSELRLRLDAACVDFASAKDGVLSGENGEPAALCDESLMQEYLESGALSEASLSEAIRRRKIFPCLFGSALKLSGTDELLKLFLQLTREPQYDEDFAAKVFKITEDAQGNRLTHMKITGGSLKVKMPVDEGEITEKVNNIRIYSGAKFRTADEAAAGTVCAVTGLTKTFAGQGLGKASDAPLPMLEPLFSYRVELPPEIDDFTALSMLRRLEEEDPQLRVVCNEQLREIHIQLMGEIQLEVLQSVIKERFGIDVSFGEGSIAYRETVAAPVEGCGHYEPLKHYAEVHLLIEPGERGSGIRYASECREDSLDRSWQRLILSNLAAKKHVGVLTGSPLTDVKITLIAGRAHIKHTEGGDFRQAACRAVRQGLRGAENVLLEPWYSFVLQLPAEYIGRAMTDLQRMGAQFGQPTGADELTLEGSAPAAALRGYQSEVTAYTRGKGRISCFPDGYRPCENAAQVIEEIGYDPDGDLENPADSVFCAHGAGFAVKWNEAPEYMHIRAESAIPDEAQKIEQKPKTNEFREREATDKELAEIFERTYGKIRRDERTAMRREPAARTSKPYTAAPLPDGPEYLLVDGYNIIFAWEKLSKMAKESLDLARNELIHIMCNYQGFRRCEVIVVFDAYKVKGNRGEVEQVGGITVVYTKEAETADMYIEKATRTLGKKHRVRVATSDRLEQLIILGGGARRMSADELLSEVLATEKAIGEFISGQKR